MNVVRMVGFLCFFYWYCFAVFVRSGLVYSLYTFWRLLVCLYNLVLEPNQMLTDWLYTPVFFLEFGLLSYFIISPCTTSGNFLFEPPRTKMARLLLLVNDIVESPEPSTHLTTCSVQCCFKLNFFF